MAVNAANASAAVPPSRPAVSVIVPAGNRAELLPATLEAITQQSLRPAEVLVTGLSGSAASLLPLAPRVRLVIQDDDVDGEAANALAMTQARAPLVAWVEAGAIPREDRLLRQAGFLTDNPDVAAVGSYMAVGAQGSVQESTAKSHIGHDALAESLRIHMPLHPSSLMLRRNAVVRSGGYRAVFGPAALYDLLLRLVASGHRLASLPDALTFSPSLLGPDLNGRLNAYRGALLARRAAAMPARDPASLSAALTVPRVGSPDYRHLLSQMDACDWTGSFSLAKAIAAHHAFANASQVIELAASDLCELETYESAIAESRNYNEEDWDEESYLTLNRDVADAKAAGSIRSGLLHYLRHGRQEGRSPGLRIASRA